MRERNAHNRKGNHFPSVQSLNTDGDISTNFLQVCAIYRLLRILVRQNDVCSQRRMKEKGLKDFIPNFTSVRLVQEKCRIQLEKVSSKFTYLRLVSRLRMSGALLLLPLYVKMPQRGITLPFYLYQASFAKTLRNGIEILNCILQKMKVMNQCTEKSSISKQFHGFDPLLELHQPCIAFPPSVQQRQRAFLKPRRRIFEEGS